MRAIGILLFCLVGTDTWAQADLQLSALARSYPLSASFNVNAGYGYRLWGSDSKDNPFYGYIRPFVEGATAGTYNSGTVGLDFFPVAFLGTTAGEEWIGNSSDYKAYDCLIYTCRGHFRRTFVQGQLALGMGKWFLLGRGKIEKWDQGRTSTLDFVDPSSGLAANATGDHLQSALAIIGVHWSESLRLSYVNQYAEMRELKGYMRMHLLTLNWTQGDWSVTVGGGAFGSTLKTWEPTGILRLSWTPAPSIALF